jgi:hypothetical protein
LGEFFERDGRFRLRSLLNRVDFVSGVLIFHHGCSRELFFDGLAVFRRDFVEPVNLLVDLVLQRAEIPMAGCDALDPTAPRRWLDKVVGGFVLLAVDTRHGNGSVHEVTQRAAGVLGYWQTGKVADLVADGRNPLRTTLRFQVPPPVVQWRAGAGRCRINSTPTPFRIVPVGKISKLAL